MWFLGAAAAVSGFAGVVRPGAANGDVEREHSDRPSDHP
jgi:hypothetical protein